MIIYCIKLPKYIKVYDFVIILFYNFYISIALLIMLNCDLKYDFSMK